MHRSRDNAMCARTTGGGEGSRLQRRRAGAAGDESVRCGRVFKHRRV
ncbi:hypothetical protein C7S13_5970 [Burkholderia cepacia]|nr:hypothetical protein [Burkholderia cepacia]